MRSFFLFYFFCRVHASMNIITRPPRLVALCARANVRFCALTTENLAAQQPGNVRAAMGHSSDPRLVDIQLERNIYNRN